MPKVLVGQNILTQNSPDTRLCSNVNNDTEVDVYQATKNNLVSRMIVSSQNYSTDLWYLRS